MLKWRVLVFDCLAIRHLQIDVASLHVCACVRVQVRVHVRACVYVCVCV